MPRLTLAVAVLLYAVHLKMEEIVIQCFLN